MWRVDGRGVQYMYWPYKAEACADNYDYLLGDRPFAYVPGQWHEAVHHLVINTPGVDDGVLEAWVDGEQVLALDNFLFRTADYDYAIDAL